MAKNVKPAAKAKTTQKRLVTTKARPESSAMEGKKAPAFELPDQTGRSVSLRDLTARGNVVLYFYPKDMTPGCTTEACSFRDHIEELHALGAEVVGISADSTASHQKFVEKHSLNFLLLSDAGNSVCNAYGVYKKKSLYGREFMGIERTTFIIGRDATILKVFPKVKVSGHTQEVIAALKELSKS